SYTLTGESVIFGFSLSLATGSYSLTGFDATLTAASCSAFLLQVTPGLFTLVGEQEDLFATGIITSGGGRKRKKKRKYTMEEIEAREELLELWANGEIELKEKE